MARVIQITPMNNPFAGQGVRTSNYVAPPHKTDFELGDAAQALALAEAAYKSPLFGALATGGKKIGEAFKSDTVEDPRAQAALAELSTEGQVPTINNQPLNHQMPAYDRFRSPMAASIENVADSVMEPGTVTPKMRGLTEPTEADKSSFQAQSAQRTLDQATRTVDRAIDNGQMAQAYVHANQPIPDDVLLKQAAAERARASLPNRPVEARPAQQGVVAAPPVVSRPTTPPVADTFEAKLATVTDINKLEALVQRLPPTDPRLVAVKQRIDDLAVDQTINPPKAETRFTIDPRHIYSQNELESLAHAMARGQGTAQDRRNLMEAFQRSEGRGVSIGSLEDLITGNHIARAGDRLSAILASGTPKKSEEELQIEEAYKRAMGLSAMNRGQAAMQNANTNAEIKPKEVAAKQQQVDVNEAKDIGTGPKAPPPGQKAGGMLGVKQSEAEEKARHDKAKEEIDAANEKSLEAYRKDIGKAARVRASKAGQKAKNDGLSKAQQQSAELRENAQNHRDQMRSLDSEERMLNAEIREAEKHPKPGYDRPDEDMNPQGAQKWDDKMDAWKAHRDVLKNAPKRLQEIEAKRNIVREETKKESVRIRSGKAPSSDEPTKPTTEPAPKAPTKDLKNEFTGDE